jgi:MFS family permease
MRSSEASEMRPTSLLRDRDFALLATSIGVSALGDWLAALALMLHIQSSTDSGLAVATLLIALWAPSVVLAGHVGVLVDRVETTRLMAIVAAAQTVVAAALGFVDATAWILVLSALLGVGFAITQSTEFALVPAIAGSRTKEANGHVETFRYVGFTVGPFLGGVLAATGGTEVAMLVNAATFAFVGIVALTLRTRRPAAAPAASEQLRARDGILQLFADRTLAVAMTVAFVSLLFMSSSIPADVFFAREVLGKGEIAFSVVYTAWTVGMILGALLLARRVPTASLATAAFAAVVLQGLGKALPPLWLVYPFMLACYFAGGIGHGLKNVMFRTLIHERVPAERHGRAFAAYNGLRNAAELAALLAGGILVSTLGARWTLLIAGGVSALAGVVGLALRPRAEARPEGAVLAD